MGGVIAGRIRHNNNMLDLARNLRVECVARLEPTPALQVDVAAPISQAVSLMCERRVGCVLVCENGMLAGIFTERDLLARVLAHAVPLQQAIRTVMTAQPITVHPDDPISKAIRRMERGGYRHLPVVDANQHPIGILSVKRIIHYLAEHFPATIYNLPPDSGIVPREREGA